MSTAPFFAEPSWYAVSTRSRQEKTAASLLQSHSIETFLPLATEKRQWSDRKQVVNRPLFPGYLFVRIPMLRDFHLRVLKVPGIVTFIGNHNGPQSIPDSEIHAVRSVLSHRIPCISDMVPNVGERVRIMRGVLAGIEGIMVRSGTDAKLVLSVETIHQSIAVRVDARDVEPVSASRS